MNINEKELMNEKELLDEKKLMQELKEIKNIKMDVVSANILYGNTFKIVGVGFLYSMGIFFLLLMMFSFKKGGMFLFFLLSKILWVVISGIIFSAIIYFIPSFMVFSVALKYVLFKEGIAPHLKYGLLLCERLKKVIKLTLLIHFSILFIIALLLSFFELEIAIFSFLGAVLIVSIIVFFMFGAFLDIEITRLGAPHLLELLKDVLNKDKSDEEDEKSKGESYERN